ncbi:mycothiol transferase [Marmoricola sp. RAF53]|uniref:mycothiol transferase n=1 Tax=Marmoricola sp. RAF53 TaxID=3233059 RepID=UPI003F9D3B1B
MDVGDLFKDAVGRVTEQVPGLVEGLDEDDLAWRPEPGANSIAWLLWHLTRVADEYSAVYAEVPPRWTGGGWYERFALPFGPEAHGYGFTAEQVGQVRASAENLAGYYADVEPVLVRFLAALTPEDLDRVVDKEWDPPVTLGVRMVSIVDDMVQHMAQAAYLRGMLDRR